MIVEGYTRNFTSAFLALSLSSLYHECDVKLRKYALSQASATVYFWF